MAWIELIKSRLLQGEVVRRLQKTMQVCEKFSLGVNFEKKRKGLTERSSVESNPGYLAHALNHTVKE